MWRHVEDDEMVDVVNEIDGYFIKSPEYAETLMAYFTLGRLMPLRAFYLRLRAGSNIQQIYSHLFGIFRNETIVTQCIRTCENLYDNNLASTTHSILEPQAKSIRRNQLCPCGSGKKYKHCHGALTA